MCLVACIFILESCAQLCTLTYIIIMIIHKGKHWHLVWLNKIGMFLWSWLGTMWIWIPSTLELLPSRIYIYTHTHIYVYIYIYKIYALWGYIFNRLGKPFSCKQLPQKTIENLKDCPLLERCNSFYTTRHRGTFPFVSIERTHNDTGLILPPESSTKHHGYSWMSPVHTRLFGCVRSISHPLPRKIVSDPPHSAPPTAPACSMNPTGANQE